MAGAIIKTYSTSFTVDLRPLIAAGATFGRKFARIKYADVRSLNVENNENEVEIVLTSGEIKVMDCNNIATIDDATVLTQESFYNKLDAKIFPEVCGYTNT